MEKVINEFKVIETDDGFRIEIKGDKEAIRRLLKHLGLFSVSGAPFVRGFRFGFGPFGGGFGAWCDPWEQPEKESSL